MKTLLILRHAKASSHLPVRDFDRPLTDRGERDAREAAVTLLRRGMTPELIVSSPAERAKATAEIVAEACGFEGEIDFHPELYLADTDELQRTVRELDGKASRVMMVGHNDGLRQFVTDLTGSDTDLPTAGLAEVALAVESWREVKKKCGKLVEMWRP